MAAGDDAPRRNDAARGNDRLGVRRATRKTAGRESTGGARCRKEGRKEGRKDPSARRSDCAAARLLSMRDEHQELPLCRLRATALFCAAQLCFTVATSCCHEPMCSPRRGRIYIHLDSAMTLLGSSVFGCKLPKTSELSRFAGERPRRTSGRQGRRRALAPCFYPL